MYRLLAILVLISGLAFAQETTQPEAAQPASEPAVQPEPATPPVVAEPAPAPAPKFVVLIPEQIDSEWFWYFYSDTAQHIVQSAVEKALINAGFDVIDLASVKRLQENGSIDQITSTDGARAIAKDAGATYAIVGTATAVKGSENVAYGVHVIRSSAEITAKIIRVSDGKILDVEDASSQKGGQAQRAAGQEALKDAGNQVARKLATAAKRVTETP